MQNDKQRNLPMNLPSGESANNKIIKAEQGEKMRLAPAESIADYSDRVKSIAKDMGVNQEMTPGEAVRILRFIRDHFGWITMDEIEFAFDLMAAGKVQKVHHYQRFSKDYVGMVLKAYQDYKHRKKIQKLALPSANSEQLKKDYLRFLWNTYQKWTKETEMPIVSTSVYETHVEMGWFSKVDGSGKDIQEHNWTKGKMVALNNAKDGKTKRAIIESFNGDRNSLALIIQATKAEYRERLEKCWLVMDEEEIKKAYGQV